MFLEELSADEIALVKSIGTLKRVLHGDVVIKEGEAGASFLLILSGRVEVRKTIRSGKYRSLLTLGPDDLVGEAGFLGVESRTASVVATTDCELIEFERQRLETLIAGHPAIGLKLYRGMARELARRLGNTDKDLADAIVWALGESRGKRLPDARIEIPSMPPLRTKLHVGGPPEE